LLLVCTEVSEFAPLVYTKQMKKFLNIFFVTLGVIFFIIILIGTYLFITDPFNLKPIFFGPSIQAEISEMVDVELPERVQTEEVETDRNPVLNDTQERALETLGVDPANIPSTISPEQEQCFIEAIGVSRVNEIKAGGAPTAAEFFRARGCL